MAYHRYHGLDTRIVRIFNTFGPSMRPNDGRVAERTDRAGFLSKRSEPTVESVHGPVNMGKPRELTVLKIARYVLNFTGSSSPIAHQPLPIDDPKVRRPDIRKAEALLGWTPKVELEEV